MAKVIELSNGRLWKTQTAALSHFKDMLARYQDGEIVDDQDDHDDLLALLERHDQIFLEDASKIGCGIKHFDRRLNRGEGYSSPGFWAVRQDASETDFSYVSAVKGTPKSVAHGFYDACRNAVGRDLQKKKQDLFDRLADDDGCLKCEISGARVELSEAQLRHADPTFGLIVSDFRKLKGWSWLEVENLMTVSEDGQLSTSFKEGSVSIAFRDYHHSRAILYIIAKKALRGLKRDSSVVVSNPIKFSQ